MPGEDTFLAAHTIKPPTSGYNCREWGVVNHEDAGFIQGEEPYG